VARKPNYQFERMERDRQKAAKLAAKAAAKRQAREDAGEAPAEPTKTED
jgi:hypothetical protein